MARRDFRTPPSLPETTETRCITIPASQPWLGLVNAALLMLTEEWRYDQVEETDMTAEATAARAMLMYVEYLGACDVACCPMRINPFNGRLQQSDDDGLTWFDVADGPWDSEEYPEFSAMPQPRPEATEAEKLCAAAATAAYVLRNLYDQTGNTLLNVVAATDWEYAGALGAMLQGFLMMIGAAAIQPFVAIASLLGVVGVKEQYVDYPLDSDDEERLTCILLENATLEASGAVTFDFQAVWDAIDLDSPKNGLVRFLLTMIGPDALNYAGAIDAGITPDCDPCICPDAFPCVGDYDFETGGQQGWVLNGYGVWDGSNWQTQNTPSVGPEAAIKYECGSEGRISEIVVTVRACQNVGIQTALLLGGVVVHSPAGQTQTANGCNLASKTFTVDPPVCADEVHVSIYTVTAANGAISGVEIS